ncbi:MAG: hypothetical protein NT001_06825 [Candidatus Woesearchaeota archaeon]|nr:hypothetical protein [Candidatus Woesearchaeota archaeon]
MLKNSRIKMVKEMEKELASLDKEINKKVAKVADIKEIEDKEKRLKEKEDMLDRKEDMLEKGVKRMRDEEQQFERAAIMRPSSSRAMPETKTSVEFVQDFAKAQRSSTLDIYELVEQAREMINSRNFTNAKQIYDRIRGEYSGLKDIEDKKKVYYEIMELKTDIELGLLG